MRQRPRDQHPRPWPQVVEDGLRTESKLWVPTAFPILWQQPHKDDATSNDFFYATPKHFLENHENRLKTVLETVHTSQLIP